MGASHFGLVVFSADPATVRDAVVGWLRAKGFEPVDGAIRVAMHGEHERGLLMASKGDRTILHYSAIDELERLQFEIDKLGAPALTYWLFDSDVWGYELHVDGAVVSAFNSDPTYFGEAEPPAGPDDLERLAAVAGVDPKGLRKLRSRRAIFSENVAQAFLDALDLGLVATKYDYGHEADTTGFDIEHLRFRKAGWDPMAGFDVADIRFRAAPAPPDMSGFDASDEPDVLRTMRWARVIGWVVWIVLWPLLQFFKLLSWVLARTSSGEDQGEGTDGPFGVHGRTLRSEQFGVELDLPDAFEPHGMDRVVRPDLTVFVFGTEEWPIRVEALPPREAKGYEVVAIAGSKLDTVDATGPMGLTRRVLATEPEGARGKHPPHSRLIGMIAGPTCVFVFSTAGPGVPTAEHVAAFDEALQSLRLLEGPQPT